MFFYFNFPVWTWLHLVAKYIQPSLPSPSKEKYEKTHALGPLHVNCVKFG